MKGTKGVLLPGRWVPNESGNILTCIRLDLGKGLHRTHASHRRHYYAMVLLALLPAVRRVRDGWSLASPDPGGRRY